MAGIQPLPEGAAEKARTEIAAFIENVSEATGHARAEVNAGFTQNTD